MNDLNDIIINVFNFIRNNLFPNLFMDLKLAEDFISNIKGYIEYIRDLFNMINFLIPVNSIIRTLIFVIILRISFFGVWGINWIIRRIVDAIP